MRNHDANDLFMFFPSNCRRLNAYFERDEKTRCLGHCRNQKIHLSRKFHK
jgi:hypothetical protein